jgi:hypothetical protein
VHACLYKLLNQFRSRFPDCKWDDIFVFSDGGPHHFKTMLKIALTAQLAKDFQTDVMWSMHEADHGKGMCDSYGDFVKSAALLAAKLGTHVINCAADLYNFCMENLTVVNAATRGQESSERILFNLSS